MPINQDMFNKMANVENFNDPSRYALLNQLCKLIFGKELKQLNSFGQGFMTQAGFGLMNSYGHQFGINDAGQNLAVLHQAIARSANFRVMDQNGNYSRGTIGGPGATTLGIARQLNSVVSGMTQTKSNAQNTHATGGLSQITLSQMMGQIIRERGGIRSGEYIQSKDVKPGVDGAEEAIEKSIAQGADPNSESMKRAVKAVALTKAVNKVTEWVNHEDELKEQQQAAQEHTKEVRKRFKQGKARKEELEEAEENERKVNVRVEAVDKIKDAKKAFHEADAEVKRLEEMEASGDENFEKEELERAKAKRDEKERVLQKETLDVVRKNSKEFKNIKVAGKDIGEIDFSDVGYDAIEDVLRGNLDIGSITDKLSKELKEGIKAASKNVKELSNIFGTDNFNELQGIAKQLQMGSLTDAKNVGEVANRIRNAKAVAERTGRTVAEVFEEQAAIAQSFKDLNGYEADSNVLEKIQRVREAAQQNSDSGATTLTADEQVAKAIDAENILTRENRRLINSEYLMNQNRDSKDENMQKVIAEYDSLKEQLNNAKTPEEYRAIKQKMERLAISTFGADVVNSETTSREADKDPRSREIIAKEAERVTRNQDATKFAKNIKYSENLRKGYEETFGENWEEQAKEHYGDIATTYGGDYQAYEADRKRGEAQRKELDKALEGKSEEEKKQIYKQEQKVENLKDKLKNAKTDEERQQAQEELTQAQTELDELGGEKYAEQRKKNEEEIEKELEAYRKELDADESLTEEEKQRAVEARRRVIENERSTNYTRNQENKNIKSTVENSKAAGSMESMQQRAKTKMEQADQFEKEISGKGETYSNTGEIKKLITGVLTGNEEINADTAFASWLDIEENKKSGLVTYDENGKVKVDDKKINEGDRDITAIKENATEEEMKEYAKNEKIRKMYGAESEEEMLELLKDPAKMQQRRMKLQDEGKVKFRKIGEGENATYVAVGSEEEDKMVAEQQEQQEKLNEKTKYLKGMQVDDIEVDPEKGIKSIEINGEKIEGKAAITKALAKEAASNKEMRENLKALADNGDEKAKEILERAESYNEMESSGQTKYEKMGDLMKSMSDNKDDFDKSWDDLSQEQKDMYGSESNYNLQRVQASQKWNTMRRTFKDEDRKKEMLEIAKENGIDWNGKDLKDLSPEDFNTIASTLAARHKDFAEEWNKLDYLNDPEELKKRADKDGKVQVQGVGDKSKDSVAIDLRDSATRDTINAAAEAAGKEGLGEDDQALQRDMLSSLETLSKCVTPEGRLKITNW